MVSACEHDTRFVFIKTADPLQWFVRAECENMPSGCGYQGDAVTVPNTYAGLPTLTFSLQAEEHIGHLIWSRDNSNTKPDICARCKHNAVHHWYPGKVTTTTACDACLSLDLETTWMDKTGLVRTGVCDHTAEWVKEPW